LKKFLRRFFTRLADRFTSKPDEKAIHHSLSNLYEAILKNPRAETTLLETRMGQVVPFEAASGRFIIFSDQHKGAGDSSDDFFTNQENYSAALDYYLKENFTYINLGDCEELWENKPEPVLELYKNILAQEAAFVKQDRYFKIFGNHDLLWFDPLAVKKYLDPIFGKTVKVLEGLVLQTRIAGKELSIFLTHGHQGDKVADNNAFSKWFVGRIWVPIQRWLELNVNTPAKDFHLTDAHNRLMYLWTMRFKNLLLVTGHTHKPVFESLDHIQRLNQQLSKAQNQGDENEAAALRGEIEKRILEYGGNPQKLTSWIHPTYYNSGCCCFNDGDITGIEIADGNIRLIKWTSKNGSPQRVVSEQSDLEKVLAGLPAS
jgi:predicted phosphodiesterase